MESSSALPVPIEQIGTLKVPARHLRQLYGEGRYEEILELADSYLWIAELFGDWESARAIVQSHSYALTELGRYTEAEFMSRDLLRRSVSRTARAKANADMADVMSRMGRLEEGLHQLAAAMTILESCPRNTWYYAAMSSVAEAARWAELYELADKATDGEPNLDRIDPMRRIIRDLQRAEALLEWGLRLDHVGRLEEAGVRFRDVISLTRRWLDPDAGPDSQLGSDQAMLGALLACGLAKTGQVEEARALATAVIPDLHADGRHFDARLAHLAYGVALRSLGKYEKAARELIAAEQLCALAGAARHRLMFQFELALVAAEATPSEATRHLLAAVRAHAQQLWRLRLDRVAMLRQARRRVQLEADHATADTAAQTDPLTRLANRRGFDRQMAAVAADTRAVTDQMCLLLVDVDNFKQINDGFSHGVGDDVLREIGHLLRTECRASDLPARFGGDEFGVFLATDLATATRIAARMRTVIRDHDWHKTALGLRVTVSMGLAPLLPGMTGEDLFTTADKHLYTAKRTGRDRLAA
ncbi:diguanylate cyclase (GGDEF)-like protein [Krasilnikovia cinnamomea]|uniref:Diguanylate cyclase (GGDEF)-like protein n=1 Tax=Krasilnikovia cinnamomea TaxID=349313 RepID=A0A4Q7ZIT9_9ACTN|nr:GGDEF domain-containing protein [Krasilnikovia cinnamomea]RZU50780.1 diguanylate cyclase (GGDEF)-like protein [Krasilnikovia cinnamomea]